MTSRPDLFSAVHKGLRALMFDTLHLLSRCDPSDDFDVERTAHQLRALVRLCERHLHDENTFIHPSLDARRPGLVWEAAEAHDAQAQYATDFLRLATRLESPGVAQRASLLRSLIGKLSEFIAHQLVHMHLEETRHTPALHETHTDDELHAMHRAIVSSIPADELALFLRWMVPALSHGERVELLTGLRAAPSPEPFHGALALARAHLAPRDFAKLCEALGVRVPSVQNARAA
ncbi:MAG: hemerythrin domain-containing protein [Myxococcota bacterium]